MVRKENIELSRLHPNNGQVVGLPKNPRFIRDEKFKKLVQSIKDDPEMLELRELIVYETGDARQYVIIGGNMRYRAMKELGFKTAPCKILPEGFPVDKLRRITLKDNSAFGETNFDDLINEWSMEDIEAAAIDIPDIASPKDDEEQDAEDDRFDVEAAKPKVPVTKPGDIYQLGEHRLICGDSTKAQYAARLMDGEKADLLVTDPPYDVDYSAKDKEKIANDNMTKPAFIEFLQKAMRAANDNMRAGAAFYVWHAGLNTSLFSEALGKVGWTVREILIWNKNVFSFGRQDYQWKHEPCLYGWKDGAAHYFIDKRNLSTVIQKELDLDKMTKADMKELLRKIYLGDLPTTVIDCDKPQKSPDHPTMKPVPLIGKLINNSSRQGDIVLDVFGGSGTTLIACEQLHRKCRMIELEPVYCDVIVKRWENLTGLKATLIGHVEVGQDRAGGNDNA